MASIVISGKEALALCEIAENKARESAKASSIRRCRRLYDDSFFRFLKRDLTDEEVVAKYQNDTSFEAVWAVSGHVWEERAYQRIDSIRCLAAISPAAISLTDEDLNALRLDESDIDKVTSKA